MVAQKKKYKDMCKVLDAKQKKLSKGLSYTQKQNEKLKLQVISLGHTPTQSEETLSGIVYKDEDFSVRGTIELNEITRERNTFKARYEEATLEIQGLKDKYEGQIDGLRATHRHLHAKLPEKVYKPN